MMMLMSCWWNFHVSLLQPPAVIASINPRSVSHEKNLFHSVKAFADASEGISITSSGISTITLHRLEHSVSISFRNLLTEFPSILNFTPKIRHHEQPSN